MFFAYGSLIFSDFTGGYMFKYIFGRVAMAVLGCAMGVNIGCIMYQAVKNVKRFYKRRKMKKMQRSNKIKKMGTKADLNTT